MADENKALVSLVELNALMARDAEVQASQVDVSDKPMVYLCQGTTPEVQNGANRVGDFLLRSKEHTFGQSFKAIVIGIDELFIKWVGPAGKGRPEWTIPKDLLPLAPQSVKDDCQWREIMREGKKVNYCPAKLTWQLAVIHLDSTVKDSKGDKKSPLDPHGFGVFYVSLDGTDEPIGKDIAKVFVRKAEGQPRKPSYKFVCGFTSTEGKYDKGTIRNHEVRITAELEPEKRSEELPILAGAAELARIYQSERAKFFAKARTTLLAMAQVGPQRGAAEARVLDAQVGPQRGAAEARVLDAQVDREAEQEYAERMAERMADKLADDEAARAKPGPDEDVPF